MTYILHSQFHPADPRHFSGIGKRYPGWSDRPAGVQWSVWHDRPESRVVLALNLEGISDGGAWPIGRLIERERVDTQLPSLASKGAGDIEVWLGRDVWNPAGQGKIRTDDYVDAPLSSLTKEKWLRALEEARLAQNSTHDGRGELEVRLKTSGQTKVCQVSPHLQFVVSLWGATLPSADERKARVASARSQLEPIRAFLSALLRTRE